MSSSYSTNIICHVVQTYHPFQELFTFKLTIVFHSSLSVAQSYTHSNVTTDNYHETILAAAGVYQAQIQNEPLWDHKYSLLLSKWKHESRTQTSSLYIHSNHNSANLFQGVLQVLVLCSYLHILINCAGQF